MDGTNIFDVNGKEIYVGDIVHYRGGGLCAHGIVVKDEKYKFAIKDDRPRTNGRIYSLYNEGKYRIENR